MRNSEGISHQISLFCFLIQTKRFDDGTLRILESALISRYVKSLLDVRRSLRDFMRHESLCVIRELNEKYVDHKLLILEFFVRAFAITGDLESCLALRYEALVLRELNSFQDYQLNVSFREWFTFAEHALDNRFYAIAKKACENALACFQTNNMIKTKDIVSSFDDLEAIRKVKGLKDIAMAKASSQSVQAQAVKYLKRKISEHDKASMLVIEKKQHTASFLFRNGIKQHNARKFQELRRL